MGYENSNNEQNCQESGEQERKEEKQQSPFTFSRRAPFQLGDEIPRHNDERNRNPPLEPCKSSAEGRYQFAGKLQDDQQGRKTHSQPNRSMHQDRSRDVGHFEVVLPSVHATDQKVAEGGCQFQWRDSSFPRKNVTPADRSRGGNLAPAPSYVLNSDIFTGRPSWADRSAAKTTR